MSVHMTPSSPSYDVLRTAYDKLGTIIEQKQRGRIYHPDGTHMPGEIFDLAEIMQLALCYIQALEEQVSNLAASLQAAKTRYPDMFR